MCVCVCECVCMVACLCSCACVSLWHNLPHSLPPSLPSLSPSLRMSMSVQDLTADTLSSAPSSSNPAQTTPTSPNASTLRQFGVGKSDVWSRLTRAGSTNLLSDNRFIIITCTLHTYVQYIYSGTSMKTLLK